MRETEWLYDRKKRQKNVVLPLRFLRHQKNKILLRCRETKSALSSWGQTEASHAKAKRGLNEFV